MKRWVFLSVQIEKEGGTHWTLSAREWLSRWRRGCPDLTEAHSAFAELGVVAILAIQLPYRRPSVRSELYLTFWW